MVTVLLLRHTTSDEGTFGHFITPVGLWHSLELPDRDNQRNISCIPVGEYICKIRYSPRFKRFTYHITDVKGRTYILIHSANFAGNVDEGYQSHLNGCIALGKGVGSFENKFGNRQKAILTSRTAVREFVSAMNNEDFKLIIRDI